ncbi:MAG: hypothetical protein RL026_1676 [Pseudomonadota bacterium]
MEVDNAPGEAWSGLDPYGRLVTSLVPRAACIAVFDADGELRWISEGAINPDLVPLVRQSLERARQRSLATGERLITQGNAPAYMFWLRDDDGALFSVVAVAWREPEPVMRDFAIVQSLLRPLLEVLRRELLARVDASRLRGALLERNRDLEMLLSVAPDRPAESVDTQDELKSLLQTALDHLKFSFAALIVPEKNLVVLRAAQGSSADSVALANSHRQLIALSRLRTDPLLIQDFPVESHGHMSSFRVLSCPVLKPGSRATGVLALYRSSHEPEIGPREGRLAEQLARRAAQLIESSYDPLTGLLTRSLFERRAAAVLLAAAAGKAWTALHIGIDRLHAINEAHGMHVGDRLISRLGELLRTRLPPGALAARSAGDRLAVLLPGESRDALRFAEALRASARGITAFSLGTASDVPLDCTVSIGVAPVAGTRRDYAHVFAAAESACKTAKDRGRDRVELYRSEDERQAVVDADAGVLTLLREALRGKGLHLEAQLIAPLGPLPGARVHFELLLRLADPRGQMIGPSRFLEVAVRHELMPAVDRWVVQQVVQRLQVHAGLLAAAPVVFSINFSAQSLADTSFADFIEQQIRGSGLPPALFCFELNESAMVSNLAAAETVLRRLRSLGCSVALDDFGTGLSSLACLRRLPLDMLKIDGSFVRDILADPRAESLVRAIAQLAEAMGLATVAEQVEQEATRLRIAALGIDYAQGYAIARPVVFEQLLQTLQAYISAVPDSTPPSWTEPRRAENA